MEHNKVPVKTLEYAKCATLSPRLHLRLIKFLASKAAHVFNSVRFEPSSHLHFHLCILALGILRDTWTQQTASLRTPAVCRKLHVYITTIHGESFLLHDTSFSTYRYAESVCHGLHILEVPPLLWSLFPSFFFFLLYFSFCQSLLPAGSKLGVMTHTCCPVFNPPQYLRPLLTTFDRSLSYLQWNLPTCVFFASPHLPQGLCLLGSPSPIRPQVDSLCTYLCVHFSAFCIYQFNSTVRYSQFVNTHVKYSEGPTGVYISLQI